MLMLNFSSQHLEKEVEKDDVEMKERDRREATTAKDDDVGDHVV